MKRLILDQSNDEFYTNHSALCRSAMPRPKLQITVRNAPAGH